MTVLEEMLIKHAIELSAIIGDHSESLKELAISFIKSEFGLELPKGDVGKVLDQEATARLFFAVGKSKPEEIRNPQKCLRLARDLWLDYTIVTTEQLTIDFLLKEAELQFAKEKESGPKLEIKQSNLVNTITKLFSEENTIIEYKKYLRKTVQYYQVAFFVLKEYFANTYEKARFELYNPYDVVVEKGIVKDENEIVETIEDKNKAKIKYLEKSVRDYKVKLEYAKKDATRDVVLTLASRGFGSPLFELHAIKKDPTTPEYISSTISNLFLALESLDIRISKESLVGKEMKFAEIEEGKFCFMDDEVLKTTDTVVIKYPGIKLGKELIVKPIIVKEI